MANVYTLDKLDSIEAEAIRGSTAQKGIYVTPNLIRRFNGDGNTAIIFKRLLYCCEQWADEEGWFYQTAETVEQVVGLGYRALQRSVKRLEKMGLIEKKLAGMPYKTYYRVNLSAYLELIKQGSSFITSDKTSPTASDKTSLSASKETCSITSGEQVILSDSSSDKESDTYAADADFSVFPEPSQPAPASAAQGDGVGASAEIADALCRFREQPVVEAIIAQAETHPDQFDLGRATATARAKAGNFAAPPPAGGDDGLAAFGLFCLYDKRGKQPPRQGTKEYKRQLERVAEALKAYGYQQAESEIVERAAELLCERKGEWVNPFYPSFAADFGSALSDAEKVVKQGGVRRTRDIEAMEASLAALEERKGGRPPPVEDDKVGQAVKAEIELQMTKATFDTWVKPASFICDDGVLTVTAPDAFARDWLENRLATTIRRTAVGVLDGAVEVRFEVNDETI